MDSLNELIHLLSRRELEGENLEACVEAVRHADDNDNYDWLDEGHERQQYAVLAELNDWVAISDKVDELHEVITDIVFDHPLPPFPYPDDNRDFPPPAYFRWLDERLAASGKGYELLLWDHGYDDNINALVVRREDTPRILALAGTLDFPAVRATDLFSFPA